MEPVPIPQHPTPADQLMVDAPKRDVHLAVAPARVRTKRAARPLAGHRLNPIRGGGERRRELVGAEQHVAA